MNYSTMPSGLPTPNGAIKKLPVVIRDRIPHVPMPVEYFDACKALQACLTIDEGKYWADKADALAAWAKIYKSDEAAIAARRLKLQAFRRMGELAGELAPQRATGKPNPKGGFTGSSPGPQALLRGHGLSKSQARDARRLAQLSKSEADTAVKRGMSVGKAAYLGRGRTANNYGRKSSDAYSWLTAGSGLQDGTSPSCHRVRSAFRSRDPHEVAEGISKGEVKQARELAIELIEWLDAFEQALPK